MTTSPQIARPMRSLDRPTLFDEYLFVDWSANNTPKRGRDSIWISRGVWNEDELSLLPGGAFCINVPTREQAFNYITGALDEALKSDHRILVSFDFAYNFPDCAESKRIAKDQAELGAKLASLIEDDDRNRSNRFEVADKMNRDVTDPSGEGPFWGRPAHQVFQNLLTTKPANRPTLREFRVVEERLRAQGRQAFSIWQLHYNGSVGSQALVGIPRVHTLRTMERFRAVSALWPFETGWVRQFDPSIKIVHAEFWPRAVPIDDSLHTIPDAAQVISAVLWAARQDADGVLGSYFDPLSKSDPDFARARQEGWILGFVDAP